MDEGFQTSIPPRKSVQNPGSSIASGGRGGNQLGAAIGGNQRLRFTPSDRQNHMHVIGSTGTGKSKFLELLLRQDIADRRAGVCLIDPHGTLCEEVVHHLAHKQSYLADRVVIFDPASDVDQIVGFNPIPNDISRIDYLIHSLVSACLKAWGQDQTDKTPRISRWLENIFYTIISNDLTLVEAAALINIHDKENRQKLLRGLHNDVVLDDWRMFEASTNTQKQNLIEGAANRLRKFIANANIRAIIGRRDRTLNLRQVMDQGKVLLVNLNGRDQITPENTKLLGIMLVNELFRCAKLRDPRDPRLKPFYVYIDEFAQFVTRDIARSLEETRKFKMFMVLAHQHLAQLREEDRYVYASVMTNCKVKVVFGGLSREDSEIMTDELVTGFVDLKAVKHEMHATRQRSRLEQRTVTSQSEGTSEGTNWSKGKSSSKTGSESSGVSASKGMSYGNTERRGPEIFLPKHQGSGTSEQNSAGRSESRQSSEGWGSSESQGRGGSESKSASRGESQVWVAVPEEYQELSSQTFWTKDELHYMEMAALKNQGVAQAFIKVGSNAPVRTQIDFVETIPFVPGLSPKKIDQFNQRSFEKHPEYCTPIADARSISEQRQIEMFGEPLRFDDEPAAAAAVTDSSPEPRIIEVAIDPGVVPELPVTLLEDEDAPASPAPETPPENPFT